MKTKFWLSFLTSISLVSTTQTSRAQTYQPSNRIPVADSSLGTQVSGNGNNFNITGGINKGQTLFHSFTDFSIPTNGAANFLNPVNNRDIITRVTGGVFSDINGLLNSNGANFFLINPNGIVFGTNAQLNVGKAFVGSTATSFDLVDGSGRMITFGTNPNGDAPLLSISPNVLFNVSRLNFSGNTAAINNFGTLQTPNNSQYIGLIGGNVTLDGSSGGGKIVAPGGRVDIGGLSGAGSVTVDNNGLVFSSVGVGRSNVVLTDGAGITVRATGTLDTVNTFFNNASSNGSSLNISANNLALVNAGGISATLPAAIDAGLETNSGVQTKPAGNINIDATGKVSLNNSAIKNTLRSGAEGSIGDVNIQAGAVDVNNSFISTTILGKGNTGNVTVTAKDAVSLTGDGGIFSSIAAGGVGKGGTIEINASSLSIVSGAQLATNTDGASATQAAGQGNAGNVTVKVTGAVDIAGSSATSYSGISSSVSTGTTGNGGNISIAAGSLFLGDGALLTASTAGSGNAGNVTVAAKNAVTLADAQIFSTVDAGGVGKSGTISIDAGALSLITGGQLGTGTRAASTTQPAGQGDAGDINIKVSGAVNIAGNNGISTSGIFSYVDTGTKGKGGNISIAAGALSLSNGTLITASTSGIGNAGNVTVTAKDAVSLSNAQIFSAVEAGGVGNSGTISIDAGSLSMTKGGQLGTGTRAASKTQPAGQGDAGDITVKVSGAVDIAGKNTSVYSGIYSYVDTGTKGNGGNISIATNSLSLGDGALLKASTSGIGNAGNVTVTAKDTVALTGSSSVFSTVEAGGVGKGGTVDINAGAVSLKDGSTIEASTFGTGNAGNVAVTAKDTISLVGSAILSTVATGTKGTGGNIAIAANSVSLKDGAAIEASTYGRGNAGNVSVTAKDAVALSDAQIFSIAEAGSVGNSGTISIDAGLLSLTNGGQLGTGTRAASATQPAGQGDAGDITVKVSGSVDIAGNNGTSNSGMFSSVDTGTKGNGGNISIAAGSFSLGDDALLKASTSGIGNAGNVTVTAKETVALTSSSKIFSTVAAGGVGKGGTVDISAGNIALTDGAKIEASTYGTGNAGNVVLTAKEAVSLSNGNIFSAVEAGGVGKGGSIDISANSVSLTDGAQLQTITRGASASLPAGAGDAGNVTLKVAGAVDIAGSDGTFFSGIRSEVATGTKGNGGNISIAAGSLSMRDGAELVASTYGTGNAGNVTVTTKDAVSLIDANIFSTVEPGGVGKGGTVDLSANSVSLKDNATIQASTYGTGDAGNVAITAKEAVSLVDSKIFSTVAAGTKGDGGNISIVAGAVSLTDNAKIEASTYGTGDAGNVAVTAKDAVSLINGNIFSTVEVGGVGKGGTIDINAGAVSLKDGAKLTTSTYGIGNAGDVSVKTTGDINISSSDSFATNSTTSRTAGIVSNTYGQGDAGKITIDTQGKLSIINNGLIFSSIASEAVGNSQGISITARELEVTNNSFISTGTIQATQVDGKGNAGDINIKTSGDIKISGYESLINLSALDILPEINSTTYGQGSAGKINIDTQGNLVLTNQGSIANTIESTSVGNSKGITISAKNISLTDLSSIESSNLGGTGTAGNIDIKSTGNLTITGTNDRSLLQGDKTNALSSIESITKGEGDAGKITIDTQGNLSIANRGGIINSITDRAVGDSQGVNITTKDLNLANFGYIQSGNYGGVGTAGNIDIKSTGNINISGTADRQTPPTLTSKSEISSATFGAGNAGKVTIETTGKLSLSNQANILSTIEKNAIGNSEGIKIAAGEIDLKNNSRINTSTGGSGNAGNIEIITTGKYTADSISTIAAITESDGDAGNINLSAKSVTLSAGAEIIPQSTSGKGKAGNLTITTPRDGFITITGTAPSGTLPSGSPGGFSSGLFATAEKDSSSVAGKISVTTGTLNIDNGGAISTRTRTNTAPIQPNNPQSSIVDGKYPAEPGAGSIFIDANNINITGGGQILTTSTGNASAGDVILKNANTKLSIAGSDPSYEQRQAALAAAFPNGYTGGATAKTTQELVAFTIDPISQYSGIFANNGLGATGKGGTIVLNPFSVKIADGGQISVNNQGTGEGGNIFLVSNLVTLNNGKISADSANTTGGNINLTTNDYLLLRNGSGISTNSGSNGKNGNGGNITISSPSIIALPGNNDITANAYNGAGGQVNITSQGLFGINYRAQGSPLTNDITASSTFGQSGAVKITTPGTDPGRDSAELPKVTTDASNQISQVCGASTSQNKLTVAGRGGLPPNANDLLTTDVVWQDARAVSSQPAVSSTTTPVKLVPPAVGWVFDGKGKVTLVAAGTPGEPTGTSVVCPK